MSIAQNGQCGNDQIELTVKQSTKQQNMLRMGNESAKLSIFWGFGHCTARGGKSFPIHAPGQLGPPEGSSREFAPAAVRVLVDECEQLKEIPATTVFPYNCTWGEMALLLIEIIDKQVRENHVRPRNGM